jgi:hypothetical protein
MNLRDPKLGLAALSLVLVTFLVVVDLKKTSPGPLSAVHQAAEGLEESACERCHGDGDVTLAEACGECHEAIEAELAGAPGLHSVLTQPEDCGHCHVEHFGAELALVDERTFALAGFATREEYAHEGIEFLLTGRHDELGCAECHANADVDLLPPGQQRFLGASQECTACHEDPHEGRMVESCQSCHGQERPFGDLDGFVHTTRFPLTGVHAGASCFDCHAEGGPHAIEALGGHDAPPDRACAECHESPHGAPFVEAVASRLEQSPDTSCEACHALDSQDFTDFDREATIGAHGASGFSLEVPHDQADCADCHGDASAREAYGERYPGRVADDCAACHESPHGTQFDRGPFAEFDCLDCHAREHFTPATFDAEAHSRTEFSLTLGHSGPACSDCHSVEPGAVLASVEFSAVSRDCAGCHEDAHAGLFVSLRPDMLGADDCATCHVTSHFADGAGDGFEHELWTGFPLDGAHAEAGCESCHERSAIPDSRGRTFGRVAELFGEPTDACATCHENVHTGAMAGDSADCAACHTSAAFSSVDREAFDHHARTGFALVGAHAAASCESCHAPRPTPDALGRTFGLAIETFPRGVERCADCHDDPHDGRFDRLNGPRVLEGRVGCARCHDQQSFVAGAREEFDHALWTGFALEGGHAEVSCEECHVSPTLHSLGRTPGKTCAACHDDPHAGQFGSRTESRCERCHQSPGAFSELIFDHQRDSRFRLDESHVTLDCVKCHQPWPLSSGGEAVRYKPLGVECSDCHLGGAPR